MINRKKNMIVALSLLSTALPVVLKAQPPQISTQAAGRPAWATSTYTQPCSPTQAYSVSSLPSAPKHTLRIPVFPSTYPSVPASTNEEKDLQAAEQAKFEAQKHFALNLGLTSLATLATLWNARDLGKRIRKGNKGKIACNAVNTALCLFAVKIFGFRLEKAYKQCEDAQYYLSPVVDQLGNLQAQIKALQEQAQSAAPEVKAQINLAIDKAKNALAKVQQ